MRIVFMNVCQCGVCGLYGVLSHQHWFQISNSDLRRAWPRVWGEDIRRDVRRPRLSRENRFKAWRFPGDGGVIRVVVGEYSINAQNQPPCHCGVDSLRRYYLKATVTDSWAFTCQVTALVLVNCQAWSTA